MDLTAEILKKLLSTALDKLKNDNQPSNKYSDPNVKRGLQSVKSLLNHGQGIEKIDINSDNIGIFASSARKFGVDFAMTKDKNTNPPTHTVFFKGKDTAAIQGAFKDFVQREENKLNKGNKKSLTLELKKLKDVIKNKDISLSGKDISKEIKKTQERSL